MAVERRIEDKKCEVDCYFAYNCSCDLFIACCSEEREDGKDVIFKLVDLPGDEGIYE